MALLNLLTWGSLQAQELAPCGVGSEVSDWLQRYQLNPDGYPKTDARLYIPMQVHIVGNSNGSGHFPIKDLAAAFCQLNRDFDSLDVQFYLVDPIRYINNTNFYNHETFGVGSQMMAQNNRPNVINVYIGPQAAGACGYYTPGRDAVALATGCIQPNDHTWAHEIGHFLSLPHTFSGWEGVDDHDFTEPAPTQIGGRQVERLDGSNCAFSGDGFCDTQADYLSNRWNCNTQNRSNTIQRDPDTLAFRSDGTLFMSYASDGCMDRFSDEQKAAMRANLLDNRPNMVSLVPPVAQPIPDSAVTLTPVFPAENELVENVSEVTLVWQAIPQATHYVVQVSLLGNFALITDQAVTTDTSWTVSGLQSDRNYFWRILPYNFAYTCAGFTPRARFQTGTLVATRPEPAELVELNLFPNPVGSGQPLALEFFSDNSQPLQWQVTDALGRAHQRGVLAVNGGYNRLSLPVAALPPGVYFLRLQLADRESYRKLVVQN